MNIRILLVAIALLMVLGLGLIPAIAQDEDPELPDGLVVPFGVTTNDTESLCFLPEGERQADCLPIEQEGDVTWFPMPVNLPAVAIPLPESNGNSVNVNFDENWSAVFGTGLIAGEETPEGVPYGYRNNFGAEARDYVFLEGDDTVNLAAPIFWNGSEFVGWTLTSEVPVFEISGHQHIIMRVNDGDEWLHDNEGYFRLTFGDTLDEAGEGSVEVVEEVYTFTVESLEDLAETVWLIDTDLPRGGQFIVRASGELDYQVGDETITAGPDGVEADAPTFRGQFDFGHLIVRRSSLYECGSTCDIDITSRDMSLRLNIGSGVTIVDGEMTITVIIVPPSDD